MKLKFFQIKAIAAEGFIITRGLHGFYEEKFYLSNLSLLFLVFFTFQVTKIKMPRIAKKSYKKKKIAKKGTLKRYKSSSVTRRTFKDETSLMFPYDHKNHVSNVLGAFRGQTTLPHRKHFCDHYADNTYALTPLTVGAAGVGGTEAIFSLNSLFDPNVSGVGHQPYNFDQLVACGYDRYRVDQVCFKITGLNPNSASTSLIAQIDAYDGSGDTLTGISWNTAKERPQTWEIKPEFSSNGKMELVVPWMNIWDLQGMTKREYQNSESYSAKYNATPNRGPTLRIAAFDATGNNAGTIYVLVEMWFKGFHMDQLMVIPS